MEDNGKAVKDAREQTATAAPHDPAPEFLEAPNHLSVPLQPDTDTELDDERLNSAAAPFLYLLGAILIAVAGYFAYTFLRG
jgi:hypothetical protein